MASVECEPITGVWGTEGQSPCCQVREAPWCWNLSSFCVSDGTGTICLLEHCTRTKIFMGTAFPCITTQLHFRTTTPWLLIYISTEFNSQPDRCCSQKHYTCFFCSAPMTQSSIIWYQQQLGGKQAQIWYTGLCGAAALASVWLMAVNSELYIPPHGLGFSFTLFSGKTTILFNMTTVSVCVLR